MMDDDDDEDKNEDDDEGVDEKENEDEIMRIIIRMKTWKIMGMIMRMTMLECYEISDT